MSRMVADPELFADRYSHPLARPYIPSKTMRLGSLCQKPGQSSSLVLAEARYRSGRGLVSQAFHSFLSGTPHPLAYGPFGYPQSIRYLRLFPALLFELIGA
jgi:hypothetical protein